MQRNIIKKESGPASRRQANASRGGYTIIETIIAVSLFIIIVMTGMGALLNANLLQQKSQNMRSVIDNLSFVMEDMSRNLRTGYNYYCITGSDVVPSVNRPKSGQSCWGIAFEPATGGNQWAYEIVTANSGATYYIRKSTDNGVTWVQLTPDEITINTGASGFSVFGAEPPSAGDSRQPFVTIKLVGTITFKNNVVTPFSLQTSVSQRQIDI